MRQYARPDRGGLPDPPLPVAAQQLAQAKANKGLTRDDQRAQCCHSPVFLQEIKADGVCWVSAVAGVWRSTLAPKGSELSQGWGREGCNKRGGDGKY